MATLYLLSKLSFFGRLDTPLFFLLAVAMETEDVVY